MFNKIVANIHQIQIKILGGKPFNVVKFTWSAIGCNSKFSNFFDFIEFYICKRAYFNECDSSAQILTNFKQG